MHHHFFKFFYEPWLVDPFQPSFPAGSNL